MKGATHGLMATKSHYLDFNPRTREGCDKAIANAMTLNLIISIHAPVKGATTLMVDVLQVVC